MVTAWSASRLSRLVRFRLAGAEGSTQDRQLRDVSDAIAGHLQATEAALSQLSSVPTHDIYSVGLKEGFLQRASESAAVSDIADLLVDTLMRRSRHISQLGELSVAPSRLARPCVDFKTPKVQGLLWASSRATPGPSIGRSEFPVVFGERGGFDAIVGGIRPFSAAR